MDVRPVVALYGLWILGEVLTAMSDPPKSLLAMAYRLATGSEHPSVLRWSNGQQTIALVIEGDAASVVVSEGRRIAYISKDCLMDQPAAAYVVDMRD